jgi:hypothetical protein
MAVIRTTYDYTPEATVIISMISSTPVLEAIAPVVKMDYFANRTARWAVQEALNYYKKYGKAPGTIMTFLYKKAVKSGRVDEELSENFLTNLDKLVGEREEAALEGDTDYLIDSVINYFQERAAKVLMDEVEQNLAAGNNARAMELIKGFEAPTVGDKVITLWDALCKPELGLVMTAPEFMALDIPPLKPILRPWLFEGDTVLLTGGAGYGKTFFILEAAKTVANGGWGMDGEWECEDPCKVLFVDGEMHPKRMQERLHLLKPSHNFTPISKLYLGKNGIHLNLMNHKTRADLEEFIKEYGLKLVILDNIFSLFEGLDMQSDQEWSAINSWLNTLRGLDVVVVLVHHPNKSNDQFGTITKTWNVTTTLLLNNAKTNGDEHACFTIKQTKGREMGLGLGGKTFQLVNGIWEVSEPASKDSSKEDALLAKTAMGLVAGKKQKTIADEVGRSVGTISKWVSGKLLGVYLMEQDGIYSYTSNGEELIDQWGFGIGI